MTTCIKVNAQDVNSYTHIKKKKEGKNIHVQEIIPMKNKPHTRHTRICARTQTHAHCTYTWHFLQRRYRKECSQIISPLSGSGGQGGQHINFQPNMIDTAVASLTGHGSTNWLKKKVQMQVSHIGGLCRLLESYRRTVFEAITERNLITKAWKREILKITISTEESRLSEWSFPAAGTGDLDLTASSNLERERHISLFRFCSLLPSIEQSRHFPDSGSQRFEVLGIHKLRAETG